MKKKSPNKSGTTDRSRKSRVSTGSRARRSAPSVTDRERLYVAGRVSGKSKKRAALDAGYGPGMAHNPGQKIDSKAGVQALFLELLRQAGATDELLAKRIYQGLHANAVVRETLYANREVLVDFKERREMAELVLRLKGLLVDKHDVTGKLTLEELLDGTNE